MKRRGPERGEGKERKGREENEKYDRGRTRGQGRQREGGGKTTEEERAADLKRLSGAQQRKGKKREGVSS